MENLGFLANTFIYSFIRISLSTLPLTSIWEKIYYSKTRAQLLQLNREETGPFLNSLHTHTNMYLHAYIYAHVDIYETLVTCVWKFKEA